MALVQSEKLCKTRAKFFMCGGTKRSSTPPRLLYTSSTPRPLLHSSTPPPLKCASCASSRDLCRQNQTGFAAWCGRMGLGRGADGRSRPKRALRALITSNNSPRRPLLPVARLDSQQYRGIDGQEPDSGIVTDFHRDEIWYLETVGGALSRTFALGLVCGHYAHFSFCRLLGADPVRCGRCALGFSSRRSAVKL